MSGPVQTRFGVYHSHLRKGREILVTIALPEADGVALVEELGPIPTRYKKIAVAVGAVADTLEDLLGPARNDAQTSAREFDIGVGIGMIARLTCEVDRQTEALQQAPADDYHAALSRRNRAAEMLRHAQHQFTSDFRIALTRARSVS